MKEFLAEYCEKNRKKINPALFERSFDKPLVDYVLDTFKNLEVLPGVTLASHEYITDQTKIHTSINKKNKRDPKIKNNKRLERLVSSGESIYDLLVMNFHVKVKTQEADVQRRVWIPKLVDGRWYIRSGKKVLPLIQIVDNSTFVKAGKKKQENILNFKTTLYPIKIFTKPVKIKFVDDDELYHAPIFQLDLFTKVTNPLLYFLAHYGLEDTLELFCLDRVISVVPEVIDEDNYVYIKINNRMYLEIHEKAMRLHDFVGKFIGSLYDCLYSDKSKITIKDAYNKNYWLERLSEVFSKKRSVDKGERVLISFKKIMDPYTKKRLCLKKYQKKNTFTIMRWMLTNYEELLKKDSNDLRTKRMRANETQAFFIDTYITKNVNSLLNTDNPSFERYMRLFNSISEDTVFKASHSVGKSSQSSMYRFERYNDFDAIELSRYTLKGPTGLNGGKKKTSMRYRDIYPSHLGRYDPNVCSSSDPGMTGYLCANVQFDENGYFDSEKSEPNNYDKMIDKAVDKIAEDNYIQSRRDIIELERSRDEDGFIVLKKKLNQQELQEEFNKYPWQYGLYVEDGALRIMPKQVGTQRDPKGFMILKPKTPEQKKDTEELPRDEDGFIILRRTIVKQPTTKKKKDK